jgi:uncharacterized protein (TIGR00730 family)
MLQSVCVFCASSSKVDSAYLGIARGVADVCIENHIHVLYGGGKVGLMGTLADRILERKGKITGIIPHFMKELDWAHSEVEEMIFVDDMRERKRRLIENIDAVVALPGGVGTLEELLEVITLKQLGRFNKPIIIVNTNGFYNSLFQLFDEMIEKQFMHELNKNIWQVIHHPSELLGAIHSASDWNAVSINKGNM